MGEILSKNTFEKNTEKYCEYCKSIVLLKNNGKYFGSGKFCNRTCMNLHRHRLSHKTTEIKGSLPEDMIVCIFCQQSFVAFNKYQNKFCRRKCLYRHYSSLKKTKKTKEIVISKKNKVERSILLISYDDEVTKKNPIISGIKTMEQIDEEYMDLTKSIVDEMV